MDNNNFNLGASLKQLYERVMAWSKANLGQIRGLISLIFGALLIFVTLKLIINIAIFAAGLILIYYGCSELGLKPVTDCMNRIFGYLGCSCKK